MVELPETVDLPTLAVILDLTERRVYQLVKDGTIKRAAKGRYNLIEAVRGYLNYLRAAANDSTLSLSEQRTRLVKLQAEKVQIELDRSRGELVSKDVVIKRELVIKASMKRVPRIAVRMVGKGAREMEAMMTKRIFDAFRELARQS